MVGAGAAAVGVHEQREVAGRAAAAVPRLAVVDLHRDDGPTADEERDPFQGKLVAQGRRPLDDLVVIPVVVPAGAGR